jgi:predicted ArsR family transcriptional regulator
MTDGLDIARIHREMTRWRILRTLDAGRPVAVSEQVLCQVVADLKLPVNRDDIRRELSYLEDKKLVAVENRDTNRPWEAELTAEGVDVVEYTVPAPHGVGRPARP